MNNYPKWEDFLSADIKDWQDTNIGGIFLHRQEKNRPELPLLSVTGGGGVVDRDTLERRDTSNADKSKYLKVSTGDIVYNTMRMWQGVSGSAHKDGLVSPAYTVLEPKESIIPLFAKYLVKEERLVQVFHRNSQGLVDDTLNLKFANLSPIKVKLPPLPEQKKIASILTSVDEVIEKTQKQIDKLQDLKKATMNELLTKGIGHTEFKDSELGRIPKSWEVVTLKDYCKRVCVGFVGTCEPYYRPTGIPLIRTGDLKGGLSEIVNGKYVTKEFHEKEKKSQLVSGDLLIARHGDFGQTCLVPESFGEANCLNVVIVRPNTQFYDPKCLKYLFNSDSIKRSFEAKSEGSTQKVISTAEISKAVFPMPTLREQEEIVHILESLDSSIEVKRAKLSQTQSLKKSLMQDLLTGKVRVTVN